jgi:hypothetical protein
VHVTLVLVPVVSGPPYVVLPHESTPERASAAPLAEIVTGARNHPAAFGARVGAALIVGGCESYLTV